MDPLSVARARFCSFAAALVLAATGVEADPSVADPELAVRTVVSGLTTPVGMAFLAANEFLVLEKNTGQVKHVRDGAVQGTVLDLAVNFASERGLLGIALHPDFPASPFVYLYWTESTTGADTNVLSEVPLLGNRVDRFQWDASTFSLAFVGNVIKLRAFQLDAGQTPRGNHNGGVIRFGPDRRLYVFVGDVGRRGQLQNLVDGPFGPGQPDDQFGGPEPDDAHLTGVIVRLDESGAAPTDNPFFAFGAELGGQVGANIQKIFSYGHRNSFGMAFEPRSGALFLQENGDDSFTELNRVRAGTNGGWVQVMGPLSRIGEYKSIETTDTDPSTECPVPLTSGLQQIRWPAESIAGSLAEARARLFMLPGAHYGDPVFSWKFDVAPGGMGFMQGGALGGQYDGDLFVGAGRDLVAGDQLFGYLLRIRLAGIGRVMSDDPLLRDRVADNLCKFDPTESASLIFGRGFGAGTDVQTGPNGNLFVVSITNGAIYEVFRP